MWVRAQVYKNLNLKLWSVRNPKTGRVIAHASHVTMVDVVFRVQEGARQRVIERRCRTVHAYAVGEVTSHGAHVPFRGRGWTRVRYNPYKSENFVTVSGRPVHGAKSLRFDHDGCWAQGLVFSKGARV